MKKLFLFWLLIASPVSAQTIVGDRLRLSAGPCLVSSTSGSPDVLVLNGDCSAIGTSVATNLTLIPTGDLVLAPTGNDVLPDVGYTKNLGALSNKYLTLHAAELWVETLVAQNTIATIGGRVLVAPTTVLTTDLAPGGTTIAVKHNQMSNGARVYMEADGKVEFMAIASVASGGGPYTYTVTRDLDGSGANQWYAGDAMLNTGTTGNGFIDLYSTAGVLSGSGPTIVGNVRTGTTYSNIAPRWAIGNLNGLYGYGAETYGTAFGDSSATNVTIDGTNGFRIRRSGTTNVASINTSGDLTLGDPAGNRLTYVASTGALTVFGANGWGRNQIPNSACEVGTENWTTFTNTSLTVTFSFALSPYRLNDLSNTCFFTVAGTPSAGQVSEAYVYPLVFPVVVGQRYEASAYLGVHRSGNTTVDIQFLSDTGFSQVGYATGSTCTAVSAGGTTLAGYCRSGVIATAPASAINARVIVITTHTAELDPYVFFVRAFFGEATSTQTLFTEWGPAGLTRITGGLIETDAIDARTIAALTITAAEIAGGTITAAKMNVTDLSAISANIGTITAGSMSGVTATFGSEVTLDSGGITIDIGTAAGNRIKWNNEASIYGDTGVLSLTSAGNIFLNTNAGGPNYLFGTDFSSTGTDMGSTAGSWGKFYFADGRIDSLAGTGTRPICADDDGDFVVCP